MRLIPTSIPLSVFYIFYNFNSRNKRRAKEFPWCEEDSQAVLLVSELPHSEGHFSPCVCFSGSFATLGYKGQAKHPGLKPLIMLLIRKLLLYSIMFPWSWKNVSVLIILLEFVFSQTCLPRLVCPGVNTAGEHQPGRAQHHQNLLFLPDCTKPMVYTCVFYNQ